jgi:hypothetical protein
VYHIFGINLESDSKLQAFSNSLAILLFIIHFEMKINIFKFNSTKKLVYCKVYFDVMSTMNRN